MRRENGGDDEILIKAIGPDVEQTYGNADLTSELTLPGASLREIQVLTRNMANQELRSDFTVLVVEDFKIEGGFQFNTQTFLAILGALVGAICLCSIVSFVWFRRVNLQNATSMTESEKRYLRIFEIRRDIKKTEKLLRFLDKKSEEYRGEQRKLRNLNSKLNDEKN